MENANPLQANTFQQQFGMAHGAAVDKLRPFMVDWVQEFIRHAPFAVLATANAQGQCDASPKGGKPGFVTVLDPTHLLLPDMPGNRLFQSYQNMEGNSHAALIFFIPGVDITARVNGTVQILTRADIERRFGAAVPLDDTDRTLQSIVLTVEQAYSHCPRALHFGHLWETQTIDANRDASPISAWTMGV